MKFFFEFYVLSTYVNLQNTPFEVGQTDTIHFTRVNRSLLKSFGEESSVLMAQQPLPSEGISADPVISTESASPEAHSARSRSKHDTKMAQKQESSASHSRCKSQKPSKQTIHSTNVHESIELKTELQGADFGEYRHTFINGSIPQEKKTSKVIAQLEGLKIKYKDKGALVLDTVSNSIDEKKHIVVNGLEFKLSDHNKYTKTNDICNSVSDARSIVKSLKLMIKNGRHIDNVGLSNKIVQFVLRKTYHVFVYVYSKQEINAMPDWCKTDNTKRGML